jgi:hypothetical protein
VSKPPTLARKLGMTEHISPLMRKVERLGLEAESLEVLAIQRGCDYYASEKPRPHISVDENLLSNVELALALLHPSLRYNSQTIRLGAAMLGAEANDPDEIAHIAAMERSEAIVRYVAECGKKFEPGNPFWDRLLENLPTLPPPKSSVVPHPTRFVAMTGFTRRGPEIVTEWIRPSREK